jgi:DNA-binding MarR family transcriptional regulator
MVTRDPQETLKAIGARGSRSPDTPLSTLLSQALIAHTIELDNEFEHRFREAGGGARVTSLTMWSNLLRFVGDGITVRELVAATGLPKRTVHSRLAGVERWRYVSVGPATGKREAYGSARGRKDEWVVRFTPAGRKAAAIWPALPGEIEARWRERFDATEMEQLVGVLRTLDEGIDAELPEYLPVVSSTYGMALELAEQPHHSGDLALVGLLAHALMAYTLDFEKSSALSLPLSSNVFRVLSGDGIPVRELPSLTGISKEAVEVSLTSLVKTDYVVVEGAPASKRTIRLTSAGGSLLIDHRRLHAQIGTRWEKRFGANVVELLRAALERIFDHPELAAGLTPYPDGWRASKPYGHQTQAALADPRGRLPHHPMVLHRGGWPDGS